jgi:hypothetical protein
MVVRITRLMEYEYVDLEHAIQDMDHWAVPPNGPRTFGTYQPIIRSAVIGPVYGEVAERVHTAVAAVAEEDPTIERAEEMRRELAERLGIQPLSAASLWETMLETVRGRVALAGNPTSAGDSELRGLLAELFGAWTGAGSQVRQTVRRESEALYDILGRLSTYWGNER